MTAREEFAATTKDLLNSTLCCEWLKVRLRKLAVAFEAGRCRKKEHSWHRNICGNCTKCLTALLRDCGLEVDDGKKNG